MSNTIAQWDRLAAESINSVLAPKGFIKVENGHWRGVWKAKSDHPFLSKKKVIEARGVAAMMVRSYRDQVREAISDRFERAKKEAENAAELISDCKFWEFAKKRKAMELHAHYRDMVGLLQILMNELDNIKINKA